MLCFALFIKSKWAGVNQQPPMHQLRMIPFNPFCGWTSSLPVEIFFFTSSLPRNSLPPPSYLPPTKPTPPHSIARAPETSSGCGAGAGPAGVGARPTRPRKGKMLTFFFVFFVCFVWRRLEKSSSSFFFVTLQVSYSATKKKAFFFFFFLFLNHSQNHLWSD
jgi:hypothetical protein